MILLRARVLLMLQGGPSKINFGCVRRHMFLLPRPSLYACIADSLALELPSLAVLVRWPRRRLHLLGWLRQRLGIRMIIEADVLS